MKREAKKQTMSQIISLVTIILVLFLTSACGNDSRATATPIMATAVPIEEPTEEPTADLLETARGTNNFNTLISLVEQADLTEKLSSEGPFTLFAPTDDVFAALSAESRDALNTDADLLVDTLLYHLVAAEISAGDLASTTAVTTILGDDLSVTTTGDQLQVGEATIVTKDIQASNGVIHLIDVLLTPPPLE